MYVHVLMGFMRETVTEDRPVAAFHLKSFSSLTYFAKYTNSGRTGTRAIASDCSSERSQNTSEQFAKDAKQPWKMIEITENKI